MKIKNNELIRAARDFAIQSLPFAKLPALRMIGNPVKKVIGLNQQVFAALIHTKEIETLEGPSHLFEKPGMLNQEAAVGYARFNKRFKRIYHVIP